MEPPQLAVAVRRQRLGSAARHECSSLDPTIGQAEAQEGSAGRSALPAIQHHLFSLRKRYAELRC